MNQTLIFNRSKVVTMVLLFDINTKLNRPTNMITSTGHFILEQRKTLLITKLLALHVYKTTIFNIYLSGSTNRLSSFTMVNASMYLDNDLQLLGYCKLSW